MRLQYNKLKNLFNNRLRKIGFEFVLVRKFILIIIFFYLLFLYLIDLNINLTFSHLTAIYKIVGTILSSLFIFIMAEGLRDKENPYKIKIFFNESKLITIIILFLISLVLFLFQENRFSLIISFLALWGFIGLSIYAISQIAVVTLNTEELWKKHINLFKKRIEEATKFIIENQIKKS